MKRWNLFLAALCVAAAPKTSNAGDRPAGKGPCNSAADCADDVCVEVNDTSYCSRQCGACPPGMYCDAKLFSMTGLKVCLKGTTAEPAKPRTPPRVPCTSDDQCPGTLICAEMLGKRDCTIPCDDDAQCRMPRAAGMSVDFWGCRLDEAQRGRKACLPKQACIQNPMACVDVDPDAVVGMAEGVMKMAQQMERGLDEATDPGFDAEPEPTPPAAAPPPKPRGMDEARFAQLLAQVREEDFEDERNAVLNTAAADNRFTCEQVGRILEVIDFGDERLSALRILAPKRVDRENSHTLLRHFEFDDEKKAAQKILSR
jgi:hypothetical protein